MKLFSTNQNIKKNNLPPSAGVVEVAPKSGLLSFAPNKPVLVVVVELNKVLGDPNIPPPTAPYKQINNIKVIIL